MGPGRAFATSCPQKTTPKPTERSVRAAVVRGSTSSLPPARSVGASSRKRRPGRFGFRRGARRRTSVTR
jgi:hypothetical protein